MATPVPAVSPETVLPPLVARTFGEPRFHTDGDIAAIAFAPDGSLRSIDEAGVLLHWSADGKQLSRHFLSDLETLWCFGPKAKLLASGNDDLLLWDTASGQLLRRLEQESWVTALAFSADGRLFVSGHDDGSVRFWDAATQKFLGEIAAHPQGISAIAFSPAGDYLATAGEDRSVRVWDTYTHKQRATLTSHTDRIPSLVWSPDGGLLVSAGWDTSARVWRSSKTEPLMLLNSHADQVHTLAWSSDGKYLACADSDFDIYLWSDAVTGKVGHVLRGHNDEIRSLAFNTDGSKLASAGSDRVIHIWDVRDGKLVAGPNPKGKHSIAVIAGDKMRLASTGGSTVRVWDVESGDDAPPTGLCSAFSVAASPNGQWLAIGGTDHFTQLWNARDGVLVASLEATKPPISAIAFSPDSNRIAHTSPADGLAWIWNCTTGEPDLILIEAADGCTLEDIAWHPSGKWVAVGGIDYLSTGERNGAVVVWDLASKQKVFVLDTGVYAVAFDPAGKFLAGAGLNDTVYLWDLETQEAIFQLEGHQQKINAIVFDPSGSYLVSGGDDGTVRILDVLSGRLLVVREFDSPVQSLAFSKGGRDLFLGNGNTTCHQTDFRKLLED
jgi:WD40 repeat protein